MINFSKVFEIIITIINKVKENIARLFIIQEFYNISVIKLTKIRFLVCIVFDTTLNYIFNISIHYSYNFYKLELFVTKGTLTKMLLEVKTVL